MEKMIIDNDTFFADVLQVLDQGKRVTIPVKGFSMLPFIRGGKDLVVLEKADGNLRADDIVLFHLGPRAGGRYVMHRILSIDGEAVDIMGDGVPKYHEHVLRNQIYAKAWKSCAGGSIPWTRTAPASSAWYTFGSACAPCAGTSCSSTGTCRGTVVGSKRI